MVRVDAEHEVFRSSWDEVRVVAKVLQPLEHGLLCFILGCRFFAKGAVLIDEIVFKALECEALLFVTIAFGD